METAAMKLQPPVQFSPFCTSTPTPCFQLYTLSSPLNKGVIIQKQNQQRDSSYFLGVTYLWTTRHKSCPGGIIWFSVSLHVDALCRKPAKTSQPIRQVSIKRATRQEETNQRTWKMFLFSAHCIRVCACFLLWCAKSFAYKGLLCEKHDHSNLMQSKKENGGE